MIDHLTFALAFLGFVMLAWQAATSATGRRLRQVEWATAAIVLAHVALVWAHRYEFSFAQATRKGYAGFLVFHAALGAIAFAPFVSQRAARWLTLFAFAAVCVGAIGAVFRYDVVRWYRVPVLVVAAFGITRSFLNWRAARRSAN